MRKISDIINEKPWMAWTLFGATVVIVFLVGLFGISIAERRGEAINRFQLVKPIAEWEPRNEIWGENFPREYESYLSTSDTSFASKYQGSVMIDNLQRDPNLVILWAGYAFAKDYNQSRGHYYAIKDIRNTLRTGQPQPGTCWSCKSTDVPRLMNKMGAANFYKAKWSELGSEVVNSIGCQDCHDPKSMNLRISRPALAEAFQRMGKDITKATHQQMRSLVCAQCHVEYYFKGKEEKYLTFPWDKGLTVENMEAYYDSVNHVDFVHKLSKTPILKAQHPDWELFQMGIHGQRGVACADCHMPYKSEGGVKFTNHHVRSPLANVAQSCQVCHRESEETLLKNVYERQDKVKELMDIAENTLVKAHITAKAAWEAGATEDEMKPVLTLIRHSQWRWDYIAASTGGAFHAPIEASRIYAASISKSQEALSYLGVILTKRGKSFPVALPDINTKDKAQKYIGLPMDSLRTDKQKFIMTVLPEWDKKASERQGKMKN